MANVRRSALLLGMAGALTFAGCLGEPPIEERWTHLEMMSLTTNENGGYAAGDTVRAGMHSRVTFRGHFVGYMVGELRVSNTLTADSLFLDHEADMVRASENVERLLEHSSPVTRVVKGFAGFPALRRYLDLEIEAPIPGFVSSVFDPPGGAPRSAFVVLYMGDGEEIELEDGRDSLVVTPFDTIDDQVLFKAVALPFGDAGIVP